MNPAFQLCQDRVTKNYAAEIGVEPAALPPGTIATIIGIIIPIIQQLMTKCSAPTNPPTTGAAAMVWHCQNRSVLAHFHIQRMIRANGGLDAGMTVRAVTNTILETGAASTPDEVQKLADEMSE